MKPLLSGCLGITVDFTSDGTPVGVASGNLWLVRLGIFILQPMEHTNHKFPTATATGVPSDVKSTVGVRARNSDLSLISESYLYIIVLVPTKTCLQQGANHTWLSSISHLRLGAPVGVISNIATASRCFVFPN